jgi:hypothetical protein
MRLAEKLDSKGLTVVSTDNIIMPGRGKKLQCQMRDILRVHTNCEIKYVNLVTNYIVIQDVNVTIIQGYPTTMLTCNCGETWNILNNPIWGPAVIKWRIIVDFNVF